MTPYTSLAYFLVLLAFAVPLIVAGARGRADGRWIVGAMVVMLPLQYYQPLVLAKGVEVPALVVLLVYALYLWGLLCLARTGKKRTRSWWIIPLGLLPMALSKFLPVTIPAWQFGFTGLSYVTFRALDVLWMATDGVLGEAGVLDLFIFLFFFPTVSSGPIDRFKRFRIEWRRRRSADEFWDDLGSGIHAVFRGLLYKNIIAALILTYVLKDPPHVAAPLRVLAYVCGYSAYLFFDFAGYSAFAVGVSQILGVHTPENFARPWAAPNIREFWNRWHITLSHWFRDHVYTRFLLMAARRKWFKNRVTASCAGYFVSFGLMGLWHGPALHFILYGLYHASLMSAYDVYLNWKKRKGWSARPPTLTGRVLGVLVTAPAFAIGLWIFSGVGWNAILRLPADHAVGAVLAQ